MLQHCFFCLYFVWLDFLHMGILLIVFKIKKFQIVMIVRYAIKDFILYLVLNCKNNFSFSKYYKLLKKNYKDLRFSQQKYKLWFIY